MSDQQCTWTEDDDGPWDVECGNRFEFNEGGPPENGFDFCPYCGKKLKSVRWRPNVELTGAAPHFGAASSDRRERG
jgi:hypothetical protein